MQVPLEPLVDTIVPDTLIPSDKLLEKKSLRPPAWAPLDPKTAGGAGAGAIAATSPLGTVQRKLSNGIRVNMISMAGESQRVAVRLFVPGGRMRESPSQPGSVLLGTRTVQEGGAFLDVTREEVIIDNIYSYLLVHIFLHLCLVVYISSNLLCEYDSIVNSLNRRWNYFVSIISSWWIS